MAVSKETWRRNILYEAAHRKETARTDRDRRTREITVIWKDGFKRLKEENDNYQERNADGYREEIAMIDAWVKEQLAAGPPK